MRKALPEITVGRSDEEELAGRVAWSCLVEPGDVVAGRLIARLGAAAALERAWADPIAPPAEAECDEGDWKAARERWRPRRRPELVEAAVDTARRNRVRLLVPTDREWPIGLDDLGHHAPVALWVRGEVAALSGHPAIALVGARASSGYGELVATELAADLAARHVSIVSGAAYGIDGAAHRATLRAGGVTVALLAGGVDRAYPAGHANLLEQIVATGAVASEVPCGTAPTKWRFLQRNRLIAAIGGATVVVEAGWRSGSLNTAAHAATLGRPLGAVPGPVTSAASAGCHRLLRDYAATCITSAADAIELLSGFDVLDIAVAERDGAAQHTRVRDALSTRSFREVDDLAARSGLSVRETLAALGLLQLEGAAERSDAGWRRCG